MEPKVSDIASELLTIELEMVDTLRDGAAAVPMDQAHIEERIRDLMAEHVQHVSELHARGAQVSHAFPRWLQSLGEYEESEQILKVMITNIGRVRWFYRDAVDWLRADDPLRDLAFEHIERLDRELAWCEDALRMRLWDEKPPPPAP